MKLNEFSKEVHENAKAHGWWETDRSFAECIVLIHSEWSEALEEARAGRPMVWYGCDFVYPSNISGCVCEPGGENSPIACPYNADGTHVDTFHPEEIGKHPRKHDCPFKDDKPEGIAVELMDGVIRILDLYGRYQHRFMYGTVKLLSAATSQANPNLRKSTTLAEILEYTHFLTAQAGSAMLATKDPHIAMKPLEACVGIALWYVQQQGLDPEKLLIEKHEYNKTRPYKHGKQF